MKCPRPLSTIWGMDKRKRHNVFAATALVPLVAMAVAGCGGGTSSQATAATPKTNSGAAWYVVSPAGSQITTASSGGSSSRY